MSMRLTLPTGSGTMPACSPWWSSGTSLARARSTSGRRRAGARRLNA